jgi:hypothetical protein
MSSDWGPPVDKYRTDALLSGDYSVDSMTLIVRNPDGELRQGEHVDKVCRTGRGCSGHHLHDRQGITPLVHKWPVLTGTTGIVESL